MRKLIIPTGYLKRNLYNIISVLLIAVTVTAIIYTSFRREKKFLAECVPLKSEAECKMLWKLSK